MIKHWKKINHRIAGFFNRKNSFISYGFYLDNLAFNYGLERKLFELDFRFRKRILKIMWGEK